MASNLSTIGFDHSKPEELEKLLLRLAQSGVARLATTVGDYAIWRSRTGAEIWFHLAPAETDDASTEREIIGLSPFFEGRSDIPLNVTKSVNRADDTIMEGAFHAWVAPDAEGEGAYPLVFDAVDFAAVSHRSLPERWRARVCGFARELTVYPDVDAFMASQGDDEHKLAAQSFFPVGLFAAASKPEREGGAHAPKPTSHGLIIGEVVDCERLVNEETDVPFYWMSVRSLAATFDVVVPHELVDGEISPGAIVRAGCWMFGRAIT